MMNEREGRGHNSTAPSNHWHVHETVAVNGYHGSEEGACIETDCSWKPILVSSPEKSPETYIKGHADFLNNLPSNSQAECESS